MLAVSRPIKTKMQFRLKFLPTLSLILLSLFAAILVVHNDSFSESATLVPSHPVTENSVIFYRAYWEQLDPSSVRIRILTFSKCFLLNSTNFLTANLDSENDHQKLDLKIQSIEAGCPWHWGFSCQWNSFVIDAVTTLGNIENNNIIVSNEVIFCKLFNP